jgi:hypothetical protein
MDDRKRKTISRFDDLASLGGNNNSFIDMLCVFLLAISPILQFYRGPIANAGITVLVVLFPYMLLRLLLILPTFRFKIMYEVIPPLIVFYLYKLFSHGGNFVVFAHVAIMIVYFIAIAAGCINVKYFIKIASVVAVLATTFLTLQYFCFYILGFHLQVAPTSLFHADSEQWVLLTKTGLIGITGKPSGFYRPSAFFMEPSHVFIYFIPLLCIFLFAPDMKSWRLKMALLITLGLFLSTSGMGICVSTGVWILYLGFYRGKDNRFKISKLFKPRNITLVVTISIFLVILYFNVPIFNKSINRILGIDITGIDAISGRVLEALLLVKTLTGSVLWFGLPDSTSDIEFNLSGFFSTLFQYGITGVLLSYLFYVKSLLKLKAQYFWLSIIIIIISFFTAHTHGPFHSLYYVAILMNGYHVVTRKKNNHRQIALQHKRNLDERRLCFE